MRLSALCTRYNGSHVPRPCATTLGLQSGRPIWRHADRGSRNLRDRGDSAGSVTARCSKFTPEAAPRDVCQQLAPAWRCHDALCRSLAQETSHPAFSGAIGGWAIAILPFMEDANLANGLAGNPPLDPAAPLELACKRPAVMTCPSAYDGASEVATVPASHYSGVFQRPLTQQRFGGRWASSRPILALPGWSAPKSPSAAPRELLRHVGGFNYTFGYVHKAGAVLFSAGSD